MEAENINWGLQNNPKEDYLPGVHPNKNIGTSNTGKDARLAHGTETKFPAMNPDGTKKLTDDTGGEELEDGDVEVIWDEKDEKDEKN